MRRRGFYIENSLNAKHHSTAESAESLVQVKIDVKTTVAHAQGVEFGMKGLCVKVAEVESDDQEDAKVVDEVVVKLTRAGELCGE